MQAARNLGFALGKRLGQRQSSTHYVDTHVVTTYNDLPSPQGSWKTQFDANQRKYNAQLIGGIAFFVGSLLFGQVAGYWEFHNDIPQTPAKIDSYK